MNDHRLSEYDREARLEEVLAQYLQASESGRAPEPSALVATYPEFADDLNEFFQDRELFENAARPFAPCSAAASAGMRHFGEYELLEQVGWGGMGVVYKARHVRLNRTVALKMILAGHFARGEDVRRFEIEAENAARLDHPNIVPIYEAGRHRGRSFFTMKLVAGGNLTAQIPRLVKDPRSGARLIATAARAVHHAHQHGILHRDLKTSNILLDDDGQPQIADFGLARMIDGEGGLTISGAILGTPSYMAPEQASSVKSLTTAVDVYGLGAILYELLTGSPPFHGDTALETLEMVREQEPQRPISHGKSVNRDLETICLKCLRKQPGERYGSAEAMAEDLERWLGGEPIHARPTSRTHRAIKWVVRRPAVAALVAMSIIAFLGLIAAATAWPYSMRLKSALDAKQIALADAGNAREAERRSRSIAEQALADARSALGAKEAALADARNAREGEKKLRAIAEQALAQSESLSYLNQIGWAEREWSVNNVEHAEQLLEQCPPSLRKWEWYHLKALCHSELLSVMHTDPVQVVLPGPEGTMFLTLTESGVLRAWNTKSGVQLRSFFDKYKAKTTDVAAVALSPDGSRWAVAYRDGTIQCWDRSGTQVCELRGMMSTCLAWSSNGNWLASGGADHIVRVWSIRSAVLAHIFVGHTQQVSAITFSPDNQKLATCSGVPARPGQPDESGEIELWDLADATKSHPGAREGPMVPPFGQHTGAITALVFTTDTALASAHGDHTVKLWDVKAVRQVGTLWGHTDSVLSVTANHDGTRLVSAGMDQTVRLWDARTGEQLRVLRGHRAAVLSTAFLPDDRRLISGAADNSAKVWQTNSDSEAASAPEAQVFYPGEGAAYDVAFSPDGMKLAVLYRSHLIVLDQLNGHELFRADASQGHVTFSADGSQVAATVSGGIAVFDSRNGKRTSFLDSWSLGWAYVYGFSFSPDGSKIAAGSVSVTADRPSGVLIWNLADSTVKPLASGGSRPVFAIAFSPDGRFLASGGGDCYQRRSGQINLWDLSTNSIVRTMTADPFCVMSLSFSKDGKRLVSGGGYYKAYQFPKKAGEWLGCAQIWDVASGQCLFGWPQPHCVFSVALSPDGSRLAAAGGPEAESSGASPRGPPSDVSVWDTTYGRQVLRLHGNRGTIYGVSFSPDGRSLASASGDRTVRIWRALLAPTGK